MVGMLILSIGLVADPQQNHANHQGSARLALGSRLIFCLYIDVFRINIIHLALVHESLHILRGNAATDGD